MSPSRARKDFGYGQLGLPSPSVSTDTVTRSEYSGFRSHGKAVLKEPLNKWSLRAPKGHGNLSLIYYPVTITTGVSYC